MALRKKGEAGEKYIFIKRLLLLLVQIVLLMKGKRIETEKGRLMAFVIKNAQTHSCTCLVCF